MAHGAGCARADGFLCHAGRAGGAACDPGAVARAVARDARLPSRDTLLGADRDTGDAARWLYTLASRLPVGAADRYAVLSAASAADRLAALSEAVDTVTEMVEFQLSE